MNFKVCPKCASGNITFNPLRYCYECYNCGHNFDPFNNEVPFVETHITGAIIVIDITFTSGDISRMNFCHSFVFENNILTLFKDIAHKYAVTIENVSRIEVVAIEH